MKFVVQETLETNSEKSLKKYKLFNCQQSNAELRKRLSQNPSRGPMWALERPMQNGLFSDVNNYSLAIALKKPLEREKDPCRPAPVSANHLGATNAKGPLTRI